MFGNPESTSRNTITLRFLFLTFCLFFYLFQCSLPYFGLPKELTSQRIIIAILLIVIIYNRSISRSYDMYNIAVFGPNYKLFFNSNVALLIYAALLYVSLGHGVGMHFLFVQLNVLLFDFLAVYIFIRLIDSFDEFARIIYYICLIQCIIIWLCLLDPIISNTIDIVFNNFEYYESARNGYAGGISCITSQGAIKLSWGLAACAYRYFSEKKNFFIIIYLFMALTTTLVARTGLFVAITGILVMMIYLIRNSNIGFFLLSSLFFAVGGLFLFQLLTGSYSNFFIEHFKRLIYMKEVGVNEAFLDGYIAADDTYVPTLSEAFWGTGMTSGVSGDGIRVNVDGGFRRTFGAIGLPFAMYIYALTAHIFYKAIISARRSEVKYFFLIIALFLLIGEFKEGNLYNTYTIGFYFTSFYLAYKDN